MHQKRIILSTHSHKIFTLLIIFLHFVESSSQSDAEILIKFKQSLKNSDALSKWDGGAAPCNGNQETWNGIICEKGKVWGLQLENMGLGGGVDLDTLTGLQNLRSLSFMNNSFEGSIPNFTRLGALKSIFLSNNQFSGKIPPETFNGMSSLKKVYLANNKFSGQIPVSLTALPKLMELSLANNGFDGKIPDFRPDGLKVFDLSNNKLDGEIPNSLSRVNASAFSGNKDLCGAPLGKCKSSHHLPVETIIIVVVLVAAALAALLVACIILRRRKRTSQQPESAAAGATATDVNRMEQGQPSSSSENANNTQGVKLAFLKDDGDKFDMPDLLKASAEVLGTGFFGSTYKAALHEGERVMVVKRFKHMNNVSREDFHEHMRRLGRLTHQNLLPVVAFYYRKEEKLLVTDYVQNVSLAVHLHADRSGSFRPPDWPTRLNIVKGIARGLNYLYDELPSLTAPHGHLKSSNVLLDRSYNPLLTDYALLPIVNQEQAQEHMTSYKSPEYKQNGRITKKTDIWSLGILILEILTGRYPSNFVQQGPGTDADLMTWVESMVGNGSNMELFDGGMRGTRHTEGEMMKLLRIGLSCCQTDLARRPEIKEAVEKIEEVKEKDDEDFYSSYTSETDMGSSRRLSDIPSFKFS